MAEYLRHLFNTPYLSQESYLRGRFVECQKSPQISPQYSFRYSAQQTALPRRNPVKGNVSVSLLASAPHSTTQGFSLIEIVVVLVLVSLLIWLAVPRYSAQQGQGYVTAMQLELLACAQNLHGLQLAANPSDENPWLALADVDGDGSGDQANGSLADDVCPISPGTKRAYNIQVQGSETGFQLRALPLTTGLEGVWVVDHLGRQSWRSEQLGSG